MATGKRTPRHVKIKVVEHLNAGTMDLDKAAKTYKVKPATLLKWKRQLSSGENGPGPSTDRSGVVKDCVTYLEMAEKSMIEELTTRKRKRMTKAETLMMLALSTLRGS